MIDRDELVAYAYALRTVRDERDELRVLIDDALPYVERDADVSDGVDGTLRPNAAMRLATRMKAAMGVKP